MNRILLGELIDLQKAASHHYITEQCLMPTRTHERNRWEETTVKMKKMRLLRNKTLARTEREQARIPTYSLQ